MEVYTLRNSPWIAARRRLSSIDDFDDNETSDVNASHLPPSAKVLLTPQKEVFAVSCYLTDSGSASQSSGSLFSGKKAWRC